MTNCKLGPLHIGHIAIPYAHIGLSARLSGKVDRDEFHQYFLRLLDRDRPGTFDLRRIRTGIVGRAEYAPVADDLRIATAQIGHEWEYAKIGEVKAELKAAKAEHAVGFKDKYKRWRGRDDLGLNGLTTVARHPVEMSDTV